MTRRDTLQCVHEPFGDAFYFGPERLSERYEKDEKGRIESGFSESTFKTIFDRIERENAEVGLSCPSALNCFSRLLSSLLLLVLTYSHAEYYYHSISYSRSNACIRHVRFLDLDHYPTALLHLSAITQGPSDSTRCQQSHIKAPYASISSGNFASTGPDAAFLPFLVSFLLPNYSHRLHVPTLTPIYPHTGQAPLHQRHNVLPCPTKRQTGFDRALPRLLQTWRRHRHNSPPRWPTTHQTGPTVPIRHCRRTGQPNRRALGTTRPVSLHIPDPPPTRQHPILLPLHRPAARRRDRLL